MVLFDKVVKDIKIIFTFEVTSSSRAENQNIQKSANLAILTGHKMMSCDTHK